MGEGYAISDKRNVIYLVLLDKSFENSFIDKICLPNKNKIYQFDQLFIGIKICESIFLSN